jgi:hypothetical protein
MPKNQLCLFPHQIAVVESLCVHGQGTINNKKMATIDLQITTTTIMMDQEVKDVAEDEVVEEEAVVEERVVVAAVVAVANNETRKLGNCVFCPLFCLRKGK